MQILLTIGHIRERCQKAGIRYAEVTRRAGRKHSAILSRVDDGGVTVRDLLDLRAALETIERERLAHLAKLHGWPKEQAA